MPDQPNREAILERLKEAVQALAAPPDAQLAIYPDFVCKADELALDFDHWFMCSRRYLSAQETETLEPILAVLDEMRGPEGPWAEDDLRTDARWEKIRGMSKRALTVFEWPIEPPPPSPDVIVRFDK